MVSTKSRSSHRADLLKKNSYKHTHTHTHTKFMLRKRQNQAEKNDMREVGCQLSLKKWNNFITTGLIFTLVSIIGQNRLPFTITMIMSSLWSMSCFVNLLLVGEHTSINIYPQELEQLNGWSETIVRIIEHTHTHTQQQQQQQQQHRAQFQKENATELEDTAQLGRHYRRRSVVFGFSSGLQGPAKPICNFIWEDSKVETSN